MDEKSGIEKFVVGNSEVEISGWKILGWKKIRVGHCSIENSEVKTFSRVEKFSRVENSGVNNFLVWKILG